MPEQTRSPIHQALNAPETKVVLWVNALIWLIVVGMVLHGSDVLALVIGAVFLRTPVPPWRWRS